MPPVINLMALVIFATSLFTRSLDPVIPQIAGDMKVDVTTAALLATAFTLPYALIQPVLGALADMLSKSRMIVVCMLVLGVATVASAFAPNFETLFALRVLGGMAAGGVFPIGLAVAGDRVPVAQRQVAIGRLLFAAMSGNLLGASGAGIVGDLIGWRGVFVATGLIDLVALVIAIPGLRSMSEKGGRFDLSTVIPNYRTIFSNPLAKYCFGAVFLEATFLFGVFPYMAGRLHATGIESASIAGIVIAGAGLGGIVYTFTVGLLVRHVSQRLLMIGGGLVMASGLLVIALGLPWQIQFVNFLVFGFGFYMLHGCIQVFVTELAPAARASAAAGHTSFFFLGHAMGPVVYGLGLSSGIGLEPVLLVGAAVLATTGFVCALRLRRPAD